MKVWLKTKIIEVASVEDSKRPYLANQNAAAAMMEIDANTCLCRVAGTPEQISPILTDPEITQLTDEEVRKIIKSKYPNSDLENVDVADPEVDKIAESLRLNPTKIRADIQMPSRVGKPLLQDQEGHLLAVISANLGLTRAQWDTYAKEKFGKSGIDIDREIRRGKNEAHEVVLNIIREAKEAKDAGHVPMLEGVKLVCKECGSVLREL
mgnify:CR=1 FL=1